MENDYHDDILYRNFIIYLKTPKTKKIETPSVSDKYYLSRPENQSLSLDEIVRKDPRTIEYKIMDIVAKMIGCFKPHICFCQPFHRCHNPVLPR